MIKGQSTEFYSQNRMSFSDLKVHQRPIPTQPGKTVAVNRISRAQESENEDSGDTSSASKKNSRL